jgi:diadenosine tetraphosphate (Ap4A) HIT family hydrolase
MNDCFFCVLLNNHNYVEDVNFPDVAVVLDGYPVSKGHLLLIPKRHVPFFFDLENFEVKQLVSLSQKIVKNIESRNYFNLPNAPCEVWDNIDGFNLGVNAGISAGQTVPHAHMHLIPRRTGDMSDPRGGVRGVIPRKRLY